MFTRRLAICLASSCFISAPASAQTPGAAELAFYSNATRSVAAGFKRIYCPPQPPPIRQICEQTPISVTSTWGIGAYAYNRAGRDRIMITAGFGAMFDMVHTAQMASFEITGKGDCVEHWARRYFTVLMDNTSRSSRGLPPLTVPGISGYAPSDPACRGITPARVLAVARENGEFHALAVEAGLAFFLLHELGHVVHGHPAIHDPSLRHSREDETEADDFVVPAAARAGQSLALSLAPIFLMVTQGDSLQWEEQSTHPLGVRRAIRLFRQFQQSYLTSPELRRVLTEQQRGETVRLLQQYIDVLQPCLAAIDAGRQCA